MRFSRVLVVGGSGFVGRHLVAALVGVIFIAWTYIVAWNNVVANQAIIERLVAEVGHVRRERGLD